MNARFVTTAAVCSALALGVSACGGGDEGAATGNGGEQLSGAIAGAGASSQAAAMEAWIVGFQQANPDVTVSYDPVGSGGGREQFVSGAVPFAGTDAALEGEELAAAQERCGGADNLIELPAYVSPIAVIYNLEGVENLQLAPETLARIMAQDITTWSDPAIAEDNPDATLPDQRITVVNRSDESGTTENFAEYLAAVAPDAWGFEVDGNWPVEGGEAAQGTSGVVNAVESGQGTIGYADASQAGDLGVAAIRVGEEYVSPTPEAAAQILQASQQQDTEGRYVFTYDLARDTSEAGTYPITLVSYELACTRYDSEEEAQLTQGFLEYVLSPEGQQAAQSNAGSAPLTDELREEYAPAIEAISAAS